MSATQSQHSPSGAPSRTTGVADAAADTATLAGVESGIDAATSPPSQVASSAAPALPMKPKGGVGGSSMFLENPDGTITEAIPLRLSRGAGKLLDRLDRFAVDAGVRRSRGNQGDSNEDSDGGRSSGNTSEANANTTYEEVEFLYTRHERMLGFMLFLQFFLEILYLYVFILHMDRSIGQVAERYGVQVNSYAVRVTFWIILVMQAWYFLAYFAIAITAMWTRRSNRYRDFGNLCLLGIFFLVLLAYVDQFNLVIFFLRMLAYVYSRFLQGLTAGFALLPPPAGQTSATPA